MANQVQTTHEHSINLSPPHSGLVNKPGSLKLASLLSQWFPIAVKERESSLYDCVVLNGVFYTRTDRIHTHTHTHTHIHAGTHMHAHTCTHTYTGDRLLRQKTPHLPLGWDFAP